MEPVLPMDHDNQNRNNQQEQLLPENVFPVLFSKLLTVKKLSFIIFCNAKQG
jgi:hypothetical protein